MINSKFYNFTKRYSHIILVITILSVTVSSTFFYNNFKKNELENFENLLDNIYLKKTINSVLNNLDPRYEIINYKVSSGDNYNTILNKLPISKVEKNKILKEISKHKKKTKLFQNQDLFFKLDKYSSTKIIEFKISVTKTKTLRFVRNLEKDNFFFEEKEKNLEKVLVFKEAKITDSLFASAVKKNIKPNLIIDFARIYGFQVDFQRDIWKNDSFQIIYENFLDNKGNVVDNGNILYANLVLQGKENPLYLFKIKNGNDHFDENGQSIRKTLMKSPINGARLSSKFGKRKHPILGYTKMHNGVDFAAPKGTPIMASGDGKVIKAGWCGGGGNCIKIRHNSTYSTVYAHLYKFASNIKKGARVKQGKIIGYVGSTGMSTGPHLHYEVIVNGKKVNPQTLKLPSGKILKGKEREKFEVVKIKTNVLKSELISKMN